MFFETLSVNRLFFRCAVPSMISMAVTSVYTITDGIFVGRLLGQDALAAVNLVMPCIMIFFALSDMIAVGSSVRISMLLGQKREREASVVFSFCLKLLVLYACLGGAAAFFAINPVLRWMGADAAVTELAVEYLRVFAVFAPPAALFFAVDNYLRICGRQHYSMGVNIAVALLNILLDALFLVCFRWGIGAAALATVISLTVGTLFSLLPFLQKKLILRLSRGRVPLRQLGRLLANGSSELFTNVASSLMSLLLNTALLRLGGSAAVAAMSIVEYLNSIIGSIIFGLAESVQPPISYCWGRKLPGRVRALEKRVLLTAALLSLAALAGMNLWGETLISLFIDPSQKELLALSLTAMHLFSLAYLTNWADDCLGSFLTALDCPVSSFFITLCGALLFPAAALLLFARLRGLAGVWHMPWAAAAASAVAAVLITRAALKKRSLSAEPAKTEKNNTQGRGPAC